MGAPLGRNGDAHYGTSIQAQIAGYLYWKSRGPQRRIYDFMCRNVQSVGLLRMPVSASFTAQAMLTGRSRVRLCPKELPSHHEIRS